MWKVFFDETIFEALYFLILCPIFSGSLQNLIDRSRKYTARRSHSGTISNLLSEMRVVWSLTNSPKSRAIPLGFQVQTDMNWIFQMRYYTLLNVLLLQSYGPSKLAVKKKSRPFGFEATFYVVVHWRILAKIRELKKR